MKTAFVVLAVLLVSVIAGCGAVSSTKPSSATADGYPLEMCIVTGQKLGTMGDPYVLKYKGKTVKFCCSNCIREFNKDTEKYMSILNEAEKKSDKSAN